MLLQAFSFNVSSTNNVLCRLAYEPTTIPYSLETAFLSPETVSEAVLQGFSLCPTNSMLLTSVPRLYKPGLRSQEPPVSKLCVLSLQTVRPVQPIRRAVWAARRSGKGSAQLFAAQVSLRLFVTEPCIVGPRYGDPTFEQQRFIPATSANHLSCAPSATQSPCRVGGPTMRGGPKGLDSAPLMITGSKVCQMSGTRDFAVV